MQRKTKLILVCVAGALAATSPGRSYAQQPQRRQPEWAMEQQTRERWLHGAQQPRFTAFIDNRSFLLVDSIRRDGNLRRLDVTLQPIATGRDSAVITADATGRVLRIDAGLTPWRSPLMQSPRDSVSMALRRRMAAGHLSLPASRVWDLVVAFPVAPRVGTRWTDTIARTASDGANLQAMSGQRMSRIVGDTTIDGQRLWIVRDSAAVTYEERHPEPERTLDSLAHVSRTVSGVVQGVYLYDPALQLTRRRVDTTTLSGVAVLRYPDGRAFRSPARYERFRIWQLHDSAQYQARRTALNNENRDRMGGMVRVPASELERRLAQNDSVLRDSLLTVLQNTSDVDAMLGLFNTLLRWGRGDAAFRRRLDSARIARGDTAHLYNTLAHRAYARPLGEADVRAMLPFMEDPGKAWALNQSRDLLYENLAQFLTEWPRAAASARDNPLCTAEACQLLGSTWSTAKEPRTRDVALVALFTTDPARWADTVLRIAGPRHPLLQSSVALAGGVGATWPAASQLPIPPVNSDWRAWLLWMDGRDPAFVREQVARRQAGSRLPLDTAPRVRFEGSHRTALRMMTARTGRDVVSELRRGYEQATNDTARAIFGTMLHGLGALQLTESQLADAFTSVVPGRVALARRELTGVIWDSATPLPDSAAAPLVDRLLANVIDGAPRWRRVEDSSSSSGPATVLHARRGRVMLSGENLPAAIREKWNGRVQIVSPGERYAGDLREQAVVYTIMPILRFGRFVKLTINSSERLARSAEQAPALYASGTTYYLMQVGDEWVIVASESWVT